MFEVRYGKVERYKTVRTSDFEEALRIYKKAKAFAEKHGLTWVIALWDNGCGHWLVKSETINPTAIV